MSSDDLDDPFGGGDDGHYFEQPPDPRGPEVILSVPPHSHDAERAVVGSILLDSEWCMARVIPFLRQEHFYTREARTVYKACSDLWDEHRQLDVLILKDKLAEVKATDKVRPEYLVECAACVATPSRVEGYARIVRKMADLRTLVTACMASQQLAYGESSIEDAIRPVTNAITLLGDLTHGSVVTRAEDGTMSAIEAAKSEGDHGVDRGEVIPWRICPRFDAAGALMRASDFPIVAARPGVGKTTFALQWAKVTSEAAQRPVVYLSLETPARDLWLKVLCAQSGVPEPKGQPITPEIEARMLESRNELVARCPLYIIDAPPADLNGLKGLMSQLKDRLDPLAFVIDYLGLVDVPFAKDEYQAVSKASRQLRVFALQNSVTLMVLHQLSRESAKQGRPPRMDDLRGSGQIEQDATQIIFLHEEAVSGQVRDVTAMIAKSRRGGAGVSQQLRMLANVSKFVGRSGPLPEKGPL